MLNRLGKQWSACAAWRACIGLSALLHTAPVMAALDAAACRRLHESGVIGPGAPVGCDRLAVVRFPYVDFNGKQHDDGE